MTDYSGRLPGLAMPYVGIVGAVLALARFLIASEFITYGIRKLLHPENIYGLIEAHHLPGELVYLVIPWQIGFGLATLLGFQTRLAAIALFGFCVIAPSIFWLNNLENLARDYATAGGFIFLFVFGPGPISLDAKYGWDGRDLAWNLSSKLWDRLPADKALVFGRALMATPFIADAFKKAQEQMLFHGDGISASFVHVLIIVESVSALMLVVGYRTRLAGAVLIVWSLVLAFDLHSPASFLGLYTENFSTMVHNLFQKNGGTLSSFYKDIAVVGALLMLVVYGPGELAWDARSRSGLMRQT